MDELLNRVLVYLAFVTAMLVLIGAGALGKWMHKRVVPTMSYNACEGEYSMSHSSTNRVPDEWVAINLLEGTAHAVVEYRHKMRIDLVLVAAEAHLKNDSELCGVSAVEFGLPLKILMTHHYTAMNGVYAPCLNDTRVINVSEQSDLCLNPADVRETARYRCITASFFDPDARRQRIEVMTGADAICFQHHIDIQNGMPLPCTEQSVRRTRCVTYAILRAEREAVTQRAAQVRVEKHVDL
jgi:hypothetical protein